MDPVTTALLKATAASASTPASDRQPVCNAYVALKDVLARKFGAGSDLIEAIVKLEAKPNSPVRRDAVAEEVADAGADNDSDALAAAGTLLKSLPGLKPPRVFISYSHDSSAHAARVLNLAGDLRRDGVDAFLDQFLTSPPEGWPAWMDAHIRDDDFVLMVCTEIYYRRVARQESSGVGLGVAWEGSLIYNHLYRDKCDLSRFVPVLLNGCSPDHIPGPVFGAAHYFVETENGYEGLLRRLFNRPAAATPPVGERPALPQLATQWKTRPAAADGTRQPDFAKASASPKVMAGRDAILSNVDGISGSTINIKIS